MIMAIPWLAITAGLAVGLVARAVFGSVRSGGPLPSCRTDVRAHLVDGRARVKPTLIVIHSTEGSSASSAAGWFANPESQGSTHIIVGEDGCFRTLNDNETAAGAGKVNPYALQIEFTGYLKWTRDEWFAHEKTLRDGRAIIHAWARRYGIPLRKLTRAELRAGKSGVATHAECSIVFGGTHMDPGPGFPLDWVLS